MSERPKFIPFFSLVVAAGLLLLAGCGADEAATTGTNSVPVPSSVSVPAPANLAAAAGNGAVALSWSASSGAMGYKVKRALTSSGSFAEIATVSAPAYTDSTVVSGTAYRYVVSAFDTSGESADSTPATATLTAPSTAAPPVPTGLGATSGNAQATLAWSASSGATSYSIKRSTTSGGSYAQLATSTSPSYTDTAVSNGTTYYYVVSAVNAAGTSANSAQVSASPVAPLGAPPTPTGLGATASSMQANLSWTASAGATSYNVKRSTTNGGPYSLIGTSTVPSYIDTTVSNATTYYYVVAAVNAAGSSADSVLAAATPTNTPPVVTPPPSSTPPTPVACSGLSAKIGVWEDITPPALSSPANMETFGAVVNPVDGTLFVTGGNQTNGGNPLTLTGVLRSTDCGATFAKVNSSQGDSANLNTGTLWAMQIDPTDPRIMYVANGYGTNPTIYKSTNRGVNWTALQPDPSGIMKFVQAIAIDANNGNHLALTWHENCPPPRTVFCLSRSTDGGATWNLFNGPTSIPNWDISGWMEGAAISILGSTSYLVSTPAGTWLTADTGQTWKQVAAEGVWVGYAGAATIAGGNLFAPGRGHVLFSPAAPASNPPFAVTTTHAMQALPNSPEITVLISDGKTLFAGTQRDDTRPFWTAPVSNPTNWTQTPQDICRGSRCRGPNTFAYDPVHHVIYAANWGVGLWRYVIE